jgi:hypothetical protein
MKSKVPFDGQRAAACRCLFLVALSVLSYTECDLAAAEGQRPNVLFLISDDLKNQGHRFGGAALLRL